MITPAWILSSSPRTRYATGALAYFAQGIPKGLLHIALPAWLAVEGVPASGVAAFLGVIMLPWAFKLVVGPLMDHYEFLPMGKRRPWVLAMQAGMVLSLLALGWVDDPANQVGLLSALGFLVNSFTASQDVAVDGMSIDLVPIEEATEMYRQLGHAELAVVPDADHGAFFSERVAAFQAIVLDFLQRHDA